jgi:hypothetical protein
MVPGTHKILLSLIPSRGNEPSLNLLINLSGDTLNFKPNLYTYKKVDIMDPIPTNHAGSSGRASLTSCRFISLIGS